MKAAKRDFDWVAAKKRLARADASLRGWITLSPERTAEILERRSRALAQTLAEENTAPQLRVLVFTAGAESYAIEIAHVRGIQRLAELTPLPDVPPYLAGITNIRGEILPLFDLRQLLGRGIRRLTDLSRVVIVGGEQLELGLLADEASGIVDLPLDAILPPAASVTGANREIVRGITKDATTVLGAAALRRDPRLFISHEPDRKTDHG